MFLLGCSLPGGRPSAARGTDAGRCGPMSCAAVVGHGAWQREQRRPRQARCCLLTSAMIARSTARRPVAVPLPRRSARSLVSQRRD